MKKQKLLEADRRICWKNTETDRCTYVRMVQIKSDSLKNHMAIAKEDKNLTKEQQRQELLKTDKRALEKAKAVESYKQACRFPKLIAQMQKNIFQSIMTASITM